MTTTEIEAKMRLADVAALESSLRAAGARKLGQHAEVNTFYDTPTGALRSGDQGLRIRVERPTEGAGPKKVTITHKGPRSHSRVKTRAETELAVSDDRAAADLLQALGFIRTLGFEKVRQQWELDGCGVDIDTLPLLGHFVEIEGPSEATVLAVRKKLGLENLPLIQSSYIAMLTTHLAERHLSTNFISFAAG